MDHQSSRVIGVLYARVLYDEKVIKVGSGSIFAKNYISSNRPEDIPNVSFNAPKNNRIILFFSSKPKVIITYGMTSRDVHFCCIPYEKNIISGRQEKIK